MIYVLQQQIFYEAYNFRALIAHQAVMKHFIMNYILNYIFRIKSKTDD